MRRTTQANSETALLNLYVQSVKKAATSTSHAEATAAAVRVREAVSATVARMLVAATGPDCKAKTARAEGCDCRSCFLIRTFADKPVNADTALEILSVEHGRLFTDWGPEGACRAFHAFVEANLLLVVSLARTTHARSSRIPILDRIQEGNKGLALAAVRFDPSRGLRFSTFAAWWIRHAIQRYVENNDREVRLPVYMIELRNKRDRERSRYHAAHGTWPSNEELAAALDVDVEQLDTFDKHYCKDAVSLSVLSTPDGYPLETSIADIGATDPVERLQKVEEHAKLMECFRELPEKERDVIAKRFGINRRGASPDGTVVETNPQEYVYPLRELGETIGKSREAVSRIEKRALNSLRAALEARGIDGTSL